MISRRDWAVFVADKYFAQFVHDSLAVHEGNNTTIAQIEDIRYCRNSPISGRLEEIFQAKRMVNCWQTMLNEVKSEEFDLSEQRLRKYQGIIAENEALLWGSFRTSAVSIRGTKIWKPIPVTELEGAYQKLLKSTQENSDKFIAAVDYYLALCDTQYFFDGNKRTAFCMMNGYLISNGYLPVNISLEQKQEYDELMIAYYETKAKEGLYRFFAKLQKEISEKFPLGEK